jgi:rhodanese-related sulfurtransferase
MRRALFICGLLVILVLSGAASGAGRSAAVTVAPAGRPADRADCGSFVMVSAEEAFIRARREPGLVLADVRSPTDHARLRIPGSVGIPLAFLKSKSFLKDRSVILIGDGFRNAALQAECEGLRKSGIEAAVLGGGLAAWDLKGQPLEGDRFALAELRRVSPQTAYQEKDSGRLIVIDIAREKSKDGPKLFPSVVHFPAGPGGLADLGRLKAALVQTTACPLSILIAAETDEGYAPIAAQLGAAGINAFFLEGGFSGYRRHLQEQALSWQPRESRVRTLSTCRPCGEKQEAAEKP